MEGKSLGPHIIKYQWYRYFFFFLKKKVSMQLAHQFVESLKRQKNQQKFYSKKKKNN
jgi:hypothetical protein